MYEQYGGGQCDYCLQFLWNMEASMYLDEEGKQKIVSQLRNEILTVTGI